MGVQPIAVPPSLAFVLNTAGDKSDVDFGYLVQTAQHESALDPQAKAPTSSATGLFQFLDSTWLQVMKTEGPRLGYQKYADAITVDGNGNYTIKDKAVRAEVLKLREDPQVAADMAAAFTRSNGAYLQSKFGRMPSPGELYIAHFLGAQGAEKMFRAELKNPDQIAADLFPREAQANPRIFYSSGQPKTIREVYKSLVALHNSVVAPAAPEATDPKFAAQQMASGQQAAGDQPDGDNAGRWSTDEVPSRFSPANMSFTSLFATRTQVGVQGPLIGTEAAAPLIAAKSGESPLALVAAPTPAPLAAIDAATGQTKAAIGDPFSAPAPLAPPDSEGAMGFTASDSAKTPIPTEQAPPAGPTDLMSGAQPTPLIPQGPQPRVLISNGVQPNPAFFTQLYSQSAF